MLTSVINDFQIMMNALRICTHATQTLIVLTLLVHTPVNVEMVILAMVAYVQVISGAFQIYFANYVTAGIYFRYISIRQLCHSWYMLYNSLFVETPRKFITNYYMFYRHANIQRTGICYVLLSPLLDINECSTQTYTCDQCGLH